MSYAQSHAVLATPIGRVRVDAVGECITGIRVGVEDMPQTAQTPLLRAAVDQLEAYFAGERTRFELPLVPSTTARGPALREAIRSIGFGETRSYGALATAIGSSPRAIGQACARNPFPIVIPCHRVLASGGRLGAYSAGQGPDTKAVLLRHERAEGWLP